MSKSTDTVTRIDAAPVREIIDGREVYADDAPPIILAGDASADHAGAWTSARVNASRGEALSRSAGSEMLAAALIYGSAYAKAPAKDAPPRLTDADGVVLTGATAYAAMIGRAESSGDAATSSRCIKVAWLADAIGAENVQALGTVDAAYKVAGAYAARVKSEQGAGKSEKQARSAAKRSANGALRRAATKGAAPGRAVLAALDPDRAKSNDDVSSRKSERAKAGRAVVDGDAAALADALVASFGDGHTRYSGMVQALAVRMDPEALAGFASALAIAASDAFEERAAQLPA